MGGDLGQAVEIEAPGAEERLGLIERDRLAGPRAGERPAQLVAGPLGHGAEPTTLYHL